MSLSLRARIERWPLTQTFTISRGAKTEAITVIAEISDGTHTGRGECVPYKRYNETVDGVQAAIEGMRGQIAQGLDRYKLQSVMRPGAARNAIDCAFWDLEAKRSGKPVHELAGLPAPQPLKTAFTIPLGTPDVMAETARKAKNRALLKVKLGGTDDAVRLEVVRKAAPKAELIVDVNEGWRADNLVVNLDACRKFGVTLIEQPLPANNDDALTAISHIIPICADESAHDSASLAPLAGKYDMINIKLDKCGGLTEALKVMEEATRMGFSLMAGCMVATSLALAPMMLIAQRARITDLDGAFLLTKDRPDGLRYDGDLVYPPVPALWG